MIHVLSVPFHYNLLEIYDLSFSTNCSLTLKIPIDPDFIWICFPLDKRIRL